jgi:hypothetical protein
MADVTEFITLSNTFVESCDVTFDETTPYPCDVFECAGDKEMEESIFIDQGLQGVDGDEDEPLLPSTSSPEHVPTSTLEALLHFDESFAPVARLESIRMLLVYATHHGFKLYQMDVKSAFLNGPIKEEVFAEQPPSFESEGYPNHVYKLHKLLYGLKQAPRAWYECLRDLLIENGFRIGKADSTLFTRKMGKDLFVCQIYVDDIIFGSTIKSFCDQFRKIMTDRFEMSTMGILTFFLRFQIKQAKEGTFITQQSIHVTYSKSLVWTKQSQSRRP